MNLVNTVKRVYCEYGASEYNEFSASLVLSV